MRKMSTLLLALILGVGFGVYGPAAGVSNVQLQGIEDHPEPNGEDHPEPN